MCEGTRSCVQCQAWKKGEMKETEKCDKCPFKVIMVDELKKSKNLQINLNNDYQLGHF